MYKLRVYAKDGSLDHEEFFNTKVLMDTRYNELFRYDLYSLNPTAWENVNNGWRRITGYQFDIEQERGVNMELIDVWDITHNCQPVYQFHAIDFNMIEVVLL